MPFTKTSLGSWAVTYNLAASTRQSEENTGGDFPANRLWLRSCSDFGRPTMRQLMQLSLDINLRLQSDHFPKHRLFADYAAILCFNLHVNQQNVHGRKDSPRGMGEGCCPQDSYNQWPFVVCDVQSPTRLGTFTIPTFNMSSRRIMH